MEVSPTDIYCDASFSKAQKVAVAGFLILASDDAHIDSDNMPPIQSVIFEETNNIRAELRGVIFALESMIKKRTSNKNTNKNVCPVVLYTDCQAIANLLERRERLEASNFRVKRTQELLSNADLYKQFYRTYDLLTPTIRWVKGHNSQKRRTQINERMARVDKAVRKQLRGYCQLTR